MAKGYELETELTHKTSMTQSHAGRGSLGAKAD